MPKKRKPPKKPARKPRAKTAEAKPKPGPQVWKRGFLSALREHGNVTVAAEQVGVNRTTAYVAAESDEAFAAAWKQALEEAADRLEYAAWDRAKNGWEEPVFGSGGAGVGTEQVGTIRKFSNTLMIFLLKGIKPEKFRERLDLRHAGKLQVHHDSGLATAIANDPAAADLACQLLERVGPCLRNAGRPGEPGEQPDLDPGQAS